MHLSSFGLISLDGSVTKLEPGLNFADYQTAMSHYTAKLALKTRLAPENSSAPKAAPQPKQAEMPVAQKSATKECAIAERQKKPVPAPRPTSSAAAIVRSFRAA